MDLVLKEDTRDAGHRLHGAMPAALTSSGPLLLCYALRVDGRVDRVSLLFGSEQLLLGHLGLLREVSIVRRMVEPTALVTGVALVRVRG